MPPLSARQVELVQKSWEPVKRDCKSNGAELLTAMFRAHPSYQQKFDDFKGTPIDKLGASQKMRSHGTTVMHSLGAMIDTLDDYEHFSKIVRQSARNHVPRQVGVEHFRNLLQGILPDFLKQKLGSQLSDEALVAWKAVVAAILSLFEEEQK